MSYRNSCKCAYHTHTAFADFLILTPWDRCSNQKIDKSLVSLVHCKIDYFYYLLNAFESNNQFQGVKIIKFPKPVCDRHIRKNSYNSGHSSRRRKSKTVSEST